jgi:hypothetical protein
MKTIIFVLGFLYATFFPLGLLAIVIDNPNQVIEEKCFADFPSNARMRAACIEQQTQIVEKTRNQLIDPTIPLEDYSLMQDKCAVDWPDDYRIRVKCMEEQVTGYKRLKEPPPKGITMKEYFIANAMCTKENPNDYRMRARCMGTRLAEIRSSKGAYSDFTSR